MFQLTKAAEYAVLLLTSINQEPLSLREVSRQKGLPLKYLEKVASKLKEEGLLESKEGSGGGYFLTKSPKDISLIEIVEAIEGKKGLVNCVHGNCSLEKGCFQSQIWKNLQIALETELNKIKLANLMGDK